jgi:hypothetical protein
MNVLCWNVWILQVKSTCCCISFFTHFARFSSSTHCTTHCTLHSRISLLFYARFYFHLHIAPGCLIFIEQSVHRIPQVAWMLRTFIQYLIPVGLRFWIIFMPSRGGCGVFGWGTALPVGRSRVRLPLVSLELFIDVIIPDTLWPWGWLSL